VRSKWELAADRAQFAIRILKRVDELGQLSGVRSGVSHLGFWCGCPTLRRQAS
jgi:hypothetical protein